MQENTSFQEQNHSQVRVQNPAANVQQDLVRLFIGKNADYFLDKWSVGPNTRNFAAFFFGPLWLLYRKMFWQGGLILAAITVITMVEFVLFPNMSERIHDRLSLAIGLGVALLVGSLGNGWYKAHVERAVARLQGSGASAESYSRQGGTSWLVAILVTFGFFVMMMLILDTLMPDYY